MTELDGATTTGDADVDAIEDRVGAFVRELEKHLGGVAITTVVALPSVFGSLVPFFFSRIYSGTDHFGDFLRAFAIAYVVFPLVLVALIINASRATRWAATTGVLLTPLLLVFVGATTTIGPLAWRMLLLLAATVLFFAIPRWCLAPPQPVTSKTKAEASDESDRTKSKIVGARRIGPSGYQRLLDGGALLVAMLALIVLLWPTPSQYRRLFGTDTDGRSVSRCSDSKGRDCAYYAMFLRARSHLEAAESLFVSPRELRSDEEATARIVASPISWFPLPPCVDGASDDPEVLCRAGAIDESLLQQALMRVAAYWSRPIPEPTARRDAPARRSVPLQEEDLERRVIENFERHFRPGALDELGFKSREKLVTPLRTCGASLVALRDSLTSSARALAMVTRDKADATLVQKEYVRNRDLLRLAEYLCAEERASVRSSRAALFATSGAALKQVQVAARTAWTTELRRLQRSARWCIASLVAALFLVILLTQEAAKGSPGLTPARRRIVGCTGALMLLLVPLLRPISEKDVDIENPATIFGSRGLSLPATVESTPDLRFEHEEPEEPLVVARTRLFVDPILTDSVRALHLSLADSSFRVRVGFVVDTASLTKVVRMLNVLDTSVTLRAR